jgi:hypothetical protein
MEPAMEPAKPDTLAAFDQHRPRLYGIAYRTS